MVTLVSLVALLVPVSMSTSARAAHFDQVTYTVVYRGGSERTENDIYVSQSDGSQLINLTHNASAFDSNTTPEMSPDGRFVTYSYWDGSKGDIGVATSDGTSNRYVTDVAYNSVTWSPSWAPDSSAVVYGKGGDDEGIYVVNRDGTGRRRVSAANGDNPRFSPDGTRIVFEQWVANASGSGGVWHLFIVGSDGTGERQLTAGPGGGSNPRWSPDGQQIVYDTWLGGGGEIYVIQAAGSAPIRISNTAGRDWKPTWSPDGTWIAWSGQESTNYDIFVARPDGSEQRRLTQYGYDLTWPEWSPDSKMLTFFSSVVWVVHVDGAGLRQLPGTPANSGSPSFGPGMVDNTPPTTAPPAQQTFSDVAPSDTHYESIEEIAARAWAGGYSDGTYRPALPVQRAQMAAFLTRALSLTVSDSPSPFHDTAGSVHERSIVTVADAGIAKGYSDGSFRPSDSVTRGQMASFLVRAFELPPATSSSSFSDISGHAHESAISTVEEAGVAGGFSDGTFRPNAPVTRGQMASFLVGASEIQ